MRPGKDLDPIRVKDIPQYFTDEFWAVYEVYSMTALWKAFPFSGGWAQQPLALMEAMTALKSEDNAIYADDLEHKYGQR